MSSMQMSTSLARGLSLALLLPLTIAMNGCGPGQKYGSPRVEYFAVSPNPISAPTADRSTRFTLEWRVETGLGYTSVIAIGQQDAKVFLHEIARVCNDACNGVLTKVNCTSSSSNSPLYRIINCSDGNVAYDRRLPVGPSVWSFQAAPYTYLNLAVDNRSDIVEISVDLQ